MATARNNDNAREAPKHPDDPEHRNASAVQAQQYRDEARAEKVRLEPTVTSLRATRNQLMATARRDGASRAAYAAARVAYFDEMGRYIFAFISERGWDARIARGNGNGGRQ